MRKAAAAIALSVLVAGTTLAVSQFRGGGRRDGGADCGPVVQNEPPPTEFIMARWRPWDPGRQAGWNHDYPCAEQHILQVITETSIVDAEISSYRIVDIRDDEEIFRYPFAYVSHPGDMILTDEEVENVREYINRGGFIMMDDFGGQGAAAEAREWSGFVQNMRRIFPDREPFELTLDHPIFRMLYDIESINLVHPMSGTTSVFLGYPDGRGGIAAVICFRNDLGDFWEYIDDRTYPVEPSAEALKLGLNFVHYAMTH
jgi:hypothetical protein